MKTIYLILCLPILLSACGYFAAEEVVLTEKTGPNYRPIYDTNIVKLSITKMDSVLAVIKPGEAFEFTDVYPITTNYTPGGDDTVHIKKYLLERGFTKGNAGYGNWEFGPRIFTIDLTKGDSTFRVIKLYYALDSVRLKRTETIRWLLPND